ELAPNSEEVAVSLINLGVVAMDQKDWKKAAHRFQQALQVWEKVLGPGHPDLVRHYDDVADFYISRERYREAAPLLEQAVLRGEKALGPEHPTVVMNLVKSARLYDAQGRYSKAMPFYQRALAAKKKQAPLSEEVGLILTNMAMNAIKQDN